MVLSKGKDDRVRLHETMRPTRQHPRQEHRRLLLDRQGHSHESAVPSGKGGMGSFAWLHRARVANCFCIPAAAMELRQAFSVDLRASHVPTDDHS